MKTIFLIGILLLCSCTMFVSKSKQQKAEDLVKSYLDSVLNDPHSYESVTFDTLIPIYQQPSTKEYEVLEDSLIKTSSDLYHAQLFHKNETQLVKSVNNLKHRVDSITKSYPKKITNYELTHTYRVKNGFGALGIHTTKFELDSSTSKILNAEEINN